MVQISLNLLLLFITVGLSGLSVVLAYDTRIFQKRTTIRETIEQIDPFVETEPYFKIKHSLVDFQYLSRPQQVTLLFRYISLFYPENAMGGQPRRFQEIVHSNSVFPDRKTLVTELKAIQDIEQVRFADRGLEVEISTIDPIAIVEVVHRVQRELRTQLKDSEGKPQSVRDDTYGY
ncbi:hypothetical protein [Haloparvum sp. PAK95]|uniref:hypothetical protein n=1 Tax=Haloparvum sp. PAK95 TaxID=3418962 RepID=UPI003D2EBC4D